MSEARKLTFTDAQSVDGNRVTYYVVTQEGEIRDDRGRVFGESGSGNYWSVEFALPLEPDEIIICFYCRRGYPMKAVVAPGQDTPTWAAPEWLTEVAAAFY